MEFTRKYLPLEWEERWRREKERQKRLIQDGGEEGIERNNQELKRIVAYNDSRMGLINGMSKKVVSDIRMTRERISEDMNAEPFQNEGLLHTYCSETYPEEVFNALKELLDSALLTDLILTTIDKHSFHVHSAVLAAVSSFIQEKLRDEKPEQFNNDKHGELRRSVLLDPEVDCAGLQAVMEFAYTGAVSSLNKDSIGSIKAAAQALGAPRILDICHQKEQSHVKESKTIPSKEQLKTTLQAIQHLWKDRIGCDVTLDVDGASFYG